MNDYKVAYDLSTSSQRIFGMAGVDFQQMNGRGMSVLPIPAIYIINEDKTIEFASVENGGLQINYATVGQILNHL